MAKATKTNDYQLVNQIVKDLDLKNVGGLSIALYVEDLVQLCNEFHKRKAVEAWERKQR